MRYSSFPSPINRARDRHGFTILPQLHVPGPRRIFHFKYLIILSALAAFMLFSFHCLSYLNCAKTDFRCDEKVTVDEYVKAQNLWLKGELSNIINHIENLPRIENLPQEGRNIERRDPSPNSDDDDKDVSEDDYGGVVSHSVDERPLNHDYDHLKNGNGEPNNFDDEQSYVNTDQDPVDELKLWKKFEKDEEDIPGIFRYLRHALNGTVEKIIPAPGTVVHDEQRPFTILSSVNAGFLDFTVNWLMSMKQIGIRYNVTLISEDPVAYEYLSKRYKRSSTISVIPTSKNYTSSKVLGFFSKEYLELVNRRAEYILNFLENGIDVLHVDVDEYWFRDPLALIRAEYDVYDVWSSQGKDGPCPCFLYLKAKPNVVSMVKDWSLRIIRKQGQENDQQALARVVWRYRVMPNSNSKKIFHRKLEDDLFPTGTVFFKPSWWQLNGKRLYVAHANRLGNHKKKTAFFREYRLWLVNPLTLDLPAVSGE